MKRGFTLLLVLLVAAACTKQPGDENGPKHRWFNPYGQEQEDVLPDKCSAREQPPPPDSPPVVGDRIPAGWNRAEYHLDVDAPKFMFSDGHWEFEYCVPVSLFVVATAAGLPGEVAETRKQGLIKHTTPWNGLRTTPWRATIIVGWAPDTAPPVMNFELIAKYEVGEGLSRAPAPDDGTVGLKCTIRQNKGTLAYQTSLDVFAEPAIEPGTGLATGPVVRCRPPAFTAVAM